jgi:hypothetical protein
MSEDLNRIVLDTNPPFEMLSESILEYINTVAEALIEANNRIELLEQQVHILLNAERR